MDYETKAPVTHIGASCLCDKHDKEMNGHNLKRLKSKKVNTNEVTYRLLLLALTLEYLFIPIDRCLDP